MRSTPRSAILLHSGRRAGLRAAALAVALAACALLAAVPAAAQSASPPTLIWNGRVVPPPGVDPGLTADRIELRVFATSSDQEIATLLETLRTKGQLALRDAMRALPAKGFVTAGKLAGSEVTVIRLAELPGGHRRVRVFCDFPVRLYDKSEPAGLDAAHPFGYLEMEVDASGENGTGTMIAAASLGFDETGLRIETAATPVMPLISVTLGRP